MKKRLSYGTVMVDIETRRIIDVIEWLKTYPNIKVVSRDGSMSYANAIREAHPNAIQVSDRFHLIKNLTDYCKEHIQKLFNSKIKIAVIQSQNQKNEDDEKLIPLKERMKYYSKMDKVNNVKMLKESGFSIKQISSELGMDIRTVSNYMEISDADQVFNKKDAPQKAIESTTQKKSKRILEVRELKEQGFSIREIERRTGYARKTISRYLDPNVSVINGRYGVKAGGILEPYHSEIDELLLKGNTFRNIEEIIREKNVKKRV
jgi:DNA-binding NarL/FixJ family response regulator